jgi:hypothetical protein
VIRTVRIPLGGFNYFRQMSVKIGNLTVTLNEVMRLLARISQDLMSLFGGLVQNVPCENQACESCRVTECNAEYAQRCLDRRCGEAQERLRRTVVANVSVESEVGVVPISARWRAAHPVMVSGVENSVDEPKVSELVLPSIPEVSHYRCSTPPSSKGQRASKPPSSKRHGNG